MVQIHSSLLQMVDGETIVLSVVVYRGSHTP